jgi:peroxiredoxin
MIGRRHRASLLPGEAMERRSARVQTLEPSSAPQRVGRRTRRPTPGPFEWFNGRKNDLAGGHSSLRMCSDHDGETVEHPRLVAARLVGKWVPMVKMETWRWRGWVDGLARGYVYLYPGSVGSPDEPAKDVALHQAFRDRKDKDIEVCGVSTQAARLRLHSVAEYELDHRLYSDDELRFANALGLPMFRSEGRWLYERLILVVEARRIARIIYPVDNAALCVDRASALLRSHR